MARASNHGVVAQRYMSRKGFAGATLLFSAIQMGAGVPAKEAFLRSILALGASQFLGPLDELYGVALLGSGIVRGVTSIAKTTKDINVANLFRSGRIGGGYMDTEQAYTMRQAAAQAIRRSQLNARISLGNEATLMHK